MPPEHLLLGGDIDDIPSSTAVLDTTVGVTNAVTVMDYLPVMEGFARNLEYGQDYVAYVVGTDSWAFYVGEGLTITRIDDTFNLHYDNLEYVILLTFSLDNSTSPRMYITPMGGGEYSGTFQNLNLFYSNLSPYANLLERSEISYASEGTFALILCGYIYYFLRRISSGLRV